MNLPFAIVLSLVLIVAACSESGFTSSKKSDEKNNGNIDGGRSDQDEPSDEPGDDANDDNDLGDGDGDELIVDPGYANAIDSEGSVKEECKVISNLPDAPVALKELYNWKPSGQFSALEAVATTPLVAPKNLNAKTPTIFAIGTTCQGMVRDSGRIFAINGKTGEQEWVSNTEVKSWLPPALGDLDNDGNLDIVAIGNDEYLYAFENNGSQKWKSDKKVVLPGISVDWEHGVSIADLKQNGTVQVVAAGTVFNGRTGKQLFQVDTPSIVFSVVANTDGKKGLEILTGKGIYRGSDGGKICEFPLEIADPAPAKVKASDKVMTVFGLTPTKVAGEGKILGFNGATCEKVMEVTNPHGAGTATSTIGLGGPLNIADFDGDDVLDLGFAGKGFYYAYKADGTLLWSVASVGASSGVTGSTTFDFNGDGKNEIVYNDEQFLRIYEGTTGKVFYETPNSSFTAREYPIIVDVDGDRSANIVVAANKCSGGTFTGIRAFSSPNDNWVHTRKIWHQHGFSPLLVKNSAKVTSINSETIYKPWLKSEHLVGLRNNIPQPKIKDECIE